MHTVETLEQAVALAEKLGYTIRQEWLAGRGGGQCELKGQKLLFLDLDLSPAERLDQLVTILREEPETLNFPVPLELQKRLDARPPL